MHCINLVSNDPYFNLALEELLLKNTKEEYLILYVNSRSVIVGKHQTCHRELNTRFISESKIPVIRRISGGGTVFHDHGNLNFSFIRHCETGKQVDFRKYTKPVIDFLYSLGLKAEFGEKNDLRTDDLKISGNAEHVHGNRVLHHGTLLFDTSIDDMRNSIRVDKTGYTSRAVASNPSHVTNLKSILNCDFSEFRSAMFDYFVKLPGNIPYVFPEVFKMEAESLSLSKYQTWEWNWAYGPEYFFNSTFEFDRVLHSCNFFVKDGLIKDCSIEGTDRMKKVSEKLIGRRHMVEDITVILRNESINFEEEDVFKFF